MKPSGAASVRRHGIIVGLLTLSLGLVTWMLREERDAALESFGERKAALEASRRFAQEIRRLRQEDSGEGAVLALEPQRLTKAVGEAVSFGGAPRESITDIWPEVPSRLAKSDYKEAGTRVRMASVSLEHLTKILFYLEEHCGEIRPKELHCWPQRGGGRNWDAELVLAQLIYDPPRK